MSIKWRNCREVEQEHAENERQYAHTYHYAGTICLCKAFWKLPKSFRDGILLHEIGHLLAGPHGGESDANDAAREELGARIAYEDSPYGERLERLKNLPQRNSKLEDEMRKRIERRLSEGWSLEKIGHQTVWNMYGHLYRIKGGILYVKTNRGEEAFGPAQESEMRANLRRNPGPEDLPYDEWIPAHAVRFNTDGSVSLMEEAPAPNRGRRRNASGERPIIHVYGERGNWTYSIEYSLENDPRGNRHYSHHFDLAFRTKEDAEQHALDHIGKPGYGGEFGTVENWQNPRIQVHGGEEGWEPAGIYAGGPGAHARRMS